MTSNVGNLDRILCVSCLHCRSRVTELENENQRLSEENQALKRLYGSREWHSATRDVRDNDKFLENFNYSVKKSKIIIEDNNTENIKKRMLKYCKKVDIDLPRKLNIEKLELWPVCNAIFEISFKHCRDSFIRNLTEPLYLLTELSEEEHKTSATDWDRKDELESVFTAYEYLIEYSKTSDKLSHVDETIVEKVITSVSNESNSELVSQLHDQVKEVVELCWRMQMLPTPMFICQPELYNENWHDIHRKSWSEKKDELIYYRPVLMNSAGGSVACKGYVGNVSEKDDSETNSSDRCIGYFICRNEEDKKMSVFDYITKRGRINSSVKCDICRNEFSVNAKFIGNVEFLHSTCFLKLRGRKV